MTEVGDDRPELRGRVDVVHFVEFEREGLGDFSSSELWRSQPPGPREDLGWNTELADVVDVRCEADPADDVVVEPHRARDRGREVRDASLMSGCVRIAGPDGVRKRGDGGAGELVLRLLVFSDVPDKGADPDDFLSAPYRVEGRGPATGAAGLRGGRTAHLHVEYRFAGVQDPSVVRLALRPQGRDDLGHSPPDVRSHRWAVDRRQGVVGTHVSEVAINQSDTRRRAGLQRLEKRERVSTDTAGARRIARRTRNHHVHSRGDRWHRTSGKQVKSRWYEWVTGDVSWSPSQVSWTPSR